MEIVGEGPPVAYERCVRTITGRAPEPSDPAAKRERVIELLSAAGYASSGDTATLLSAVDAWRADRQVPGKSDRGAGRCVRRLLRRAVGPPPAAAPADGVRARAACEREVSLDRERVVLRVDELPGSRAPT